LPTCSVAAFLGAALRFWADMLAGKMSNADANRIVLKVD
jgi:hypothetical protein